MKRLDRLLSTVNGNGKPVNPLEQLNRQVDLVRTRVISAATRHSNGLFLFGRAGVGKTFAVTEQLKKCKVDWVEVRLPASRRRARSTCWTRARTSASSAMTWPKCSAGSGHGSTG